MKQSGSKSSGPGGRPAGKGGGKSGARRGGNNKNTIVTPGEGWRMFAMPREDLEYLGTIQRGMEIGALARDQTGAYLQVNGDMRQVLNTSRIENALRVASPRPPPYRQRKPAASAAPVVVIVKPRRRVIVPPS